MAAGGRRLPEVFADEFADPLDLPALRFGLAAAIFTNGNRSQSELLTRLARLAHKLRRACRK